MVVVIAAATLLMISVQFVSVFLFGIILVMNLEIAVITPPVGLNLYTLKAVAPMLKIEEIIRSVKKGIYCASLGGGQVDITSGKFVFSCTEAYRVKDGRVGAPVKGAVLCVNQPSRD